MECVQFQCVQPFCGEINYSAEYGVHFDQTYIDPYSAISFRPTRLFRKQDGQFNREWKSIDGSFVHAYIHNGEAVYSIQAIAIRMADNHQDFFFA